MNAIFGEPGAFGSPAELLGAAAGAASCAVPSPGGFTESARPLSGTGITTIFGLIGAAPAAGAEGAGAAPAGAETRIGAGAAAGVGIRTAGIETFGVDEEALAGAATEAGETEMGRAAGAC